MQGYRADVDSQQLCVLTVHAHPDDEASKGAPTLAKYHAEGNTVQLGGLMVAVGAPVGCGQSRCRARLTCHLTYLRLTRRGLERWRRAGLSRRQSSQIARLQPWSVR